MLPCYAWDLKQAPKAPMLKTPVQCSEVGSLGGVCCYLVNESTHLQIKVMEALGGGAWLELEVTGVALAGYILSLVLPFPSSWSP